MFCCFLLAANAFPVLSSVVIIVSMIIVFSSNDVLESGAHFDFGGCINLHSRLSLITIMATRSKRMRKEKSGFENDEKRNSKNGEKVTMPQAKLRCQVSL